MLKAVLFDLDNTLVDFWKMKRLCSQEAVRAMVDAGLKIEEKQGIEMLFRLYEEEGMENQKIFDKFIKSINGKIDYKILASGIAAYRRVKLGSLATYPHTTETLIRLREKGLKLGIVSDAPAKQAWLRLAELNLADFFDVVIAREGKAEMKPHEMPFKKALRKLKLKPSQILFVGDNPKRDILGAQRLGMKTALAKYGQIFECSEGIKADYELKEIRELEKIVSGQTRLKRNV
ncbi:MAG: TIGR02253 family HAD-type hydrolase [Candidatus Diapherotrites archaeon]